MLYRQTYNKPQIKSAVCKSCGSNSFLYSRGSIKCTNCGEIISKPKGNKYGAIKTEFGGNVYDSKFESSCAADLELRKRAGDILDYDTQFRIEADIYNSLGHVVAHKRHKVDFRIHLKDGSFELLEAKGVITTDYQWRRDIVVAIWLSEHKDYIYTVVQQKSYKSRK